MERDGDTELPGVLWRRGSGCAIFVCLEDFWVKAAVLPAVD